MTMTETLTPRSDALARRLTKRENQVLDLLMRGYTNKQMAAILQISPRTVEEYRYKVIRKHGARNAIELIFKLFATDERKGQ